MHINTVSTDLVNTWRARESPHCIFMFVSAISLIYFIAQSNCIRNFRLHSSNLDKRTQRLRNAKALVSSQLHDLSFLLTKHNLNFYFTCQSKTIYNHEVSIRETDPTIVPQQRQHLLVMI